MVTSVSISDSQSLGIADNTISQPVGPIIAPTVLPPVVPIPIITPLVMPPSIAPIPSVPTAASIRPVAPIPVHPPVFKPLVTQNGEVRGSDSDSDQDDSVPSSVNKSTAYEISEESRVVRERQKKALQELMIKRWAAALVVPTNDMAVRARLRRPGEPITFFGEREMERRERLRVIMEKLDADGQFEKLMKDHEEEEAAASVTRDDVEEEIVQYPFYTEGSKALLDN